MPVHVMLFEVVLGLLMPVMLLAGCGWALYARASEAYMGWLSGG